MLSNSLPIRPVPFHDETALSFLLRVSSANGYIHIFQILSAVGYSSEETGLIADSKSIPRFTKILKAFGIPRHDDLVIDHSGPTTRCGRSYLRKKFSDKFFRDEPTVFCPICLRKKLYWRKDWMFLPNHSCLEHKCLLLDTCPRCKKPLSLRRSHLYICRYCKFDIRKSNVVSSDVSDIEWFFEQLQENPDITHILNFWLASYNVFKLSDKPTSQQFLLRLTREYMSDFKSVEHWFIDLIYYYCEKQHPRIQLLPFFKSDQKLKTFAEYISSKFNHLKIPLIKKIDKQLTKSEACSILGIKLYNLNCLIETEAIKMKILANGKTVILTTELERYLVSDKNKTSKPKTTNEANNNQLPENLVRLIDAAEHLSINYETARKLVNTDWLEKKLIVFNGRQRIFVTKDSLNYFYENYRTIGTLAKNLGVNPTNLSEKLKHLGIMPVGGTGIDKALTSIFRKSDIGDLTSRKINSIEKYATKTGRKPIIGAEKNNVDHNIPLSRVANKLGISTQKVAVLVRKGWLKAADIKSFDTQKIYIDIKSLNSFLTQLRRSDYLTINEAATLLKCSTGTLYLYWIKGGLVDLHDLVYWRFVSKKDIDNVISIRRNYMTPSEASSFLGMHRTHINNLERQGKIKSHKFSNLHLYKIEDVNSMKI